MLIIIEICFSFTDSSKSQENSPYESVDTEGAKNRAIYQNDVFNRGAENLKEEGQYEELKEGEIRKNEQERPYSKLTRI